MSSDLDPSAPRNSESTQGSALDRTHYVDIGFIADGLSEFAEEPVADAVALPPVDSVTPVNNVTHVNAVTPENGVTPVDSIAVTEVGLVENSPTPVSTARDAESSTTLPGTVLSISELLENGVTIDWREAVAIARSICHAIGRHPSTGVPEYMLDPRHIEINEQGEVRVLPGAPGGDPFVKQVGRILRALLENGSAPAPLRLLASQASFELSGFETVRELSEALSTYDAPQEAEAIRTAFKRGREAKSSYRPPPDWSLSTRSASEAIAPVAWNANVPKVRRYRRWLRAATVAAVVVLVGFVGFKVIQTAMNFTVGSTSVDQRVSAVPPRTNSPSSSSSNGAATSASTASPTPVARQRLLAESTPISAPRGRPVNQPRTAPSVAESDSTPAVVTNVESYILDRVAPPVAIESPEAMRRRFDALITANPLYKLDAGRASAEEILALRESKRQLLPPVARRDVATAREALDLGDVDRAQSSAARAAAIMEDPDFGPAQSGLRESLRQVMTQTRTLQARADDHVYTTADAGVVAPLPLGRQLPATGPSGIASELVGQLELLIDRNGQVEAVKLHTPLNRYHERMIVSAAKAWRYEPATKDGTSVRFRLFRTVTLPED